MILKKKQNNSQTKKELKPIKIHKMVFKSILMK